VWDTTTAKTTRLVDLGVVRLFACADGRVLFTTTAAPGLLVDLATNAALLPAAQQQIPAVHAAVSGDGKVVATVHAGQPGLVRLWDVGTGRETLRWATGHSSVVTVALSPDGKRLATAGARETHVILWETATGHRAAVLPVHDDMRQILFAPDGRRLVTRD